MLKLETQTQGISALPTEPIMMGQGKVSSQGILRRFGGGVQVLRENLARIAESGINDNQKLHIDCTRTGSAAQFGFRALTV